MRDFVDALHVVFTVWLFFRVYEIDARLKKAIEALQLLGTAMILGSVKPPEKKP